MRVAKKEADGRLTITIEIGQAAIPELRSAINTALPASALIGSEIAQELLKRLKRVLDNG